MAALIDDGNRSAAATSADGPGAQRSEDRVSTKQASVVGLAELQELLLSTDTLGEFLGAIATTAAREFGATVSCGVTVRRHQRRATTLGVSDDFAAILDEAQYSQRQGPCLHALDTGELVEMPDIAADSRWPRFTELASGHGAAAVLSTPMITDRTGTVGALNLYSRQRHFFGEPERERAQRFALLAAGAVAIGVQLAQRTELTDDLRFALSSRSVIDQAMGIVMGQRRCSADEAFAVLRHRSQTGNVKLRDVAAQIVLTVTGVLSDVPAATETSNAGPGRHAGTDG